MRGIRIVATTTLAVLAMVSFDATAAQKSASREAFFRCKDRNGQTHYADSVPPECSGLDTEVLNEHGMVLRVIEGEPTRLKRLQREAEEAKVRKEKEARALRDRTLIETYLTVEDIERLRDQRLEQLDAQYRVTEQNIVKLQDRLVPFDCIEFNPDLRWIDVMSDIAFLVMDLASHGRTDLAFALLNRYLEVTGDYDGVRVLPFYAVYRALVRAKVDALEQRAERPRGEAAHPLVESPRITLGPSTRRSWTYDASRVAW